MVTKDNEITGTVPYQEVVGSLIHLANCTRPDIAFAVNHVSRFNRCHSVEHWTAVKRILRYIKGTANLKLRFSRQGGTDMHAFSDSDWASDLDERKSCSGFVILMSNGAVSWFSHRQEIIAYSSCEAEYIALSDCNKQILWLRKMQLDLCGHKNTTTVYVDNDSAINLSKNDQYSNRTKHIDVRYHHTRKLVEDKIIEVKYVNTKINTADSLTKAVTQAKTSYCSEAMGLVE